jgi:hypothetical protein
MSDSHLDAPVREGSHVVVRSLPKCPVPGGGGEHLFAPPEQLFGLAAGPNDEPRQVRHRGMGDGDGDMGTAAMKVGMGNAVPRRFHCGMVPI